MKKKLVIIFLFFTMISCVSSLNKKNLPNLIIEGKKQNRLIKYRVPDYGDGHRDGCVVGHEMSMEILELNEKIIKGIVSDSKTKEPLKMASINLFISNNKYPIRLHTGDNGKFQEEPKSKIMKIEASCFGYRALIIEF